MAPTILCVGGVPKQNKMAIKGPESKQKSKGDSKCYRVPLIHIDILDGVKSFLKCGTLKCCTTLKRPGGSNGRHRFLGSKI